MSVAAWAGIHKHEHIEAIGKGVEGRERDAAFEPKAAEQEASLTLFSERRPEPAAGPHRSRGADSVDAAFGAITGLGNPFSFVDLIPLDRKEFWHLENLAACSTNA